MGLLSAAMLSAMDLLTDLTCMGQMQQQVQKNIDSPYHLAKLIALNGYAANLESDPRSLLNLLLSPSTDPFLLESTANVIASAVADGRLNIKQVLNFVAVSASTFDPNRALYAVRMLYRATKEAFIVRSFDNLDPSFHPFSSIEFALDTCLPILASEIELDRAFALRSPAWSVFLFNFIQTITTTVSDFNYTTAYSVLRIWNVIAKSLDRSHLLEFLSRLTPRVFFSSGFGIHLVSAFPAADFSDPALVALVCHFILEGFDESLPVLSAVSFLGSHLPSIPKAYQSIVFKVLGFLLLLSDSVHLKALIADLAELNFDLIPLQDWQMLRSGLIIFLFLGGSSRQIERLLSLQKADDGIVFEIEAAESAPQGRLKWLIDVESVSSTWSLDSTGASASESCSRAILYVFAKLLARNDQHSANQILSSFSHPILFNAFPLILFRLSQDSFESNPAALIQQCWSLVHICRDDFTLAKVLVVVEDLGNLDPIISIRIYHAIWLKFNRSFPHLKQEILSALGPQMSPDLQIAVAATLKSICAKKGIEQSEFLISICSNFLSLTSKFDEMSLKALSDILLVYADLCNQQVTSAMNLHSFLAKHHAYPYWRIQNAFLSFYSSFDVRNTEGSARLF